MPAFPGHCGPEGNELKQIMTIDADPFEQGRRAARENIPVAGNPYQDGSEAYSLWAAGHEQVAESAEADEAEGT